MVRSSATRSPCINGLAIFAFSEWHPCSCPFQGFRLDVNGAETIAGRKSKKNVWRFSLYNFKCSYFSAEKGNLPILKLTKAN